MPLKAWFHEVRHKNWKTPSDVKAKYGSASFFKDNRMVFNIGDNKCRLVLKMNYSSKIVFIRFVGTPEGDELELLATLVGLYEEKQYPIRLPDPVEALKFGMDQMGLRQKDMARHLNSKSKASEILNGKKTLTLSIMRALHKDLGIPAEELLHSENPQFNKSPPEINWTNFPLRKMSKRGWVEQVKDIKKHAEEIMTTFFEEAGGKAALSTHHCRRAFQRDIMRRR